MLMNEKNDLVMFFNQSDIKEVFLVHELLSRPKSWSHDRSLGVLCCYMQLFKFKKTREKISNLSTILQSFVNPRLAYGVTGFIIWFSEEIFLSCGEGGIGTIVSTIQVLYLYWIQKKFKYISYRLISFIFFIYGEFSSF